MARLIYGASALDGLERAFAALRTQDPPAAERAVHAIVSAVDNLSTHPLMGPRIDDEIRELVISYGATGFLALYRFVVARDEVRVLAVRQQRGLGYLP
ncbi:MAG: type II toxin-antitoxin system RelE/ParE family toxin [Steroidobacteraceae bacterium]